MSTVLQVENISKMYRLGEVSTGALVHDVNRWWHKIRGKEDPYVSLAQTNARDQKGSTEYVWALKDISFSVEQGDVLGIIGRNGAGKSTLLKILSRITAPTTGKIKVKGRIASLLEVGTGFHPELTGRENIYLNGAILGMTKAEINRKFDEIVDFSGVERYIDTPVKRYSSGMYVRLAFAVAAHLESEILIIDEVLAVGDAEFQKKCLGKMKDVSASEGRTVLFVSHNMGAVQNLCKTALLLTLGQVVCNSTPNEAIQVYLSRKSVSVLKRENIATKPVFFEQIDVYDSYDIIKSEFRFDEEIILKLKLKQKEKLSSVQVCIGMLDRNGERLFSAIYDIENENFETEIETELICKLAGGFIVPGFYSFLFQLYLPPGNVIYDELSEVLSIRIHETGSDFSRFGEGTYGKFFIPYSFKKIIS